MKRCWNVKCGRSRPRGTSARQYSQSQAQSCSPTHPRFQGDQSPCQAPEGRSAERPPISSSSASVAAWTCGRVPRAAAERSRRRSPIGSDPRPPMQWQRCDRARDGRRGRGLGRLVAPQPLRHGTRDQHGEPAVLEKRERRGGAGRRRVCGREQLERGVLGSDVRAGHVVPRDLRVGHDAPVGRHDLEDRLAERPRWTHGGGQRDRSLADRGGQRVEQWVRTRPRTGHGTRRRPGASRRSARPPRGRAERPPTSPSTPPPARHVRRVGSPARRLEPAGHWGSRGSSAPASPAV